MAKARHNFTSLEIEAVEYEAKKLLLSLGKYFSDANKYAANSDVKIINYIAKKQYVIRLCVTVKHKSGKSRKDEVVNISRDYIKSAMGGLEIARGAEQIAVTHREKLQAIAKNITKNINTRIKVYKNVAKLSLVAGTADMHNFTMEEIKYVKKQAAKLRSSIAASFPDSNAFIVNYKVDFLHTGRPNDDLFVSVTVDGVFDQFNSHRLVSVERRLYKPSPDVLELTHERVHVDDKYKCQGIGSKVLAFTGNLSKKMNIDIVHVQAAKQDGGRAWVVRGYVIDAMDKVKLSKGRGCTLRKELRGRINEYFVNDKHRREYLLDIVCKDDTLAFSNYAMTDEFHFLFRDLFIGSIWGGYIKPDRFKLLHKAGYFTYFGKLSKKQYAMQRIIGFGKLKLTDAVALVNKKGSERALRQLGLQNTARRGRLALVKDDRTEWVAREPAISYSA